MNKEKFLVSSCRTTRLYDVYSKNHHYRVLADGKSRRTFAV